MDDSPLTPEASGSPLTISFNSPIFTAMKKPISCILGLLLCFSAWAQDAWDLRRCVDYALANNISVKQQDVQARLARINYDQSKLSQYPTLNLQGSVGVSSGRSIDPTTNQFTTNAIVYNNFGLQTNADVFNFFSKKHGIAGYRLEALAADANVDKVKNDVALNVALGYLQVLLARQQVEVFRVKQRQTDAQLSTTRKQVSAGALPELNAATLEAQLAQDSANVVNAKTSEIQALYSLKALLALDASVPFDVTTPPVSLIPIETLADLAPQRVYELALKNLPQHRVNSLRLQSAQQNVASSRAALYPAFSVGANINTSVSSTKDQARLLHVINNGLQPIGVVQGTNDTVVTQKSTPVYSFYSDPYGRQFSDNLRRGISLTMTVPIFNGGQARSAWKRAKLNVETYALQLQQDTLTLKQDIYKAYADAINALEKFNAAAKAVEAARKASDFAGKRYNIGLLTTLELINAQTQFTSSELQRASAQFEYVFRMKLLEFYKGQGLKL
jgi:outer membrane protein